MIGFVFVHPSALANTAISSNFSTNAASSGITSCKQDGIFSLLFNFSTASYKFSAPTFLANVS